MEEVIMKLYIDLQKASSGLVKKPVQVKGKDGKEFTRMQWVSADSGKPVEQKSPKQDSTPVKTQRHHIDEKIKKLSREEKYNLINKHGIEWKRHDHSAIDHKNAVVALKEHMYKNPHLMGAEHLPKDEKNHAHNTASGKDKLTHFTNAYKKHPELLYSMMKHVGVIDKHDVDPRTVPGKQHTSKGGDGTGDIQHMRNMMALKKHLKENPHVMDELKQHKEFGKVHSKETTGKMNLAQKGGNAITGVLNQMSREEKYNWCRKLGIAKVDPLHDHNIDPKVAPIQHMRNMMALKKHIEKNPSDLNISAVTGDTHKDEVSRQNSLSSEEKRIHEIKQLLRQVPRETKLKWADELKDNPIMKDRTKSENEHVDNMHKISALNKVMTSDPKVLEKYKPEAEKHQLLNTKIGNKMMGKVLRQIVGLKGIGDVTAGQGEDKGKEWEFGIGSFARIEEDENGKPVLSVVDTGKEGEDWNEHTIPMEKVRDFVMSSKKSKVSKSFGEELRDTIFIVSLDDFKKSKDTRNGLTQEVVTYVRDGHTVTRKQWVRNNFAEHAKQAEEHKKQKQDDVEQRERSRKAKKTLKEDEKLKHHIEFEEKRAKKKEDKEPEGYRRARAKKLDKKILEKFRQKLKKKKEKEKQKKNHKHGK